MDQKKRLNNILLLNSLFYFFGETLNFLPLIINTETKQFFQLEEAVLQSVSSCRQNGYVYRA